jgi:3'(2'), 5'-bisphosphate nucleotidase
MVGEEDAAALRDPANAELRGKVMDLSRSVLPDLRDDDVLAAIDHGIYGGGPRGRHWALDPIDGTKGFLRLEQYAVALALIEDGEVVLGVLGCPNLPHDPARADAGRGCLFVGTKGEGAWWRTLDSDRPSRLAVSATTDPSAARITESVESGHSAQDESAKVAELLHIGGAPVRMDSQAKYAAVARGDADIYLRLPTRKDYVEKIWDHAAGFRVIAEAGGKVTDVNGRPLDFSLGRGLADNSGVVATNGPLHDHVLAAVRAVLT